MDPYDEFEDDLLVEALSDVNLWDMINDKGGLPITLEREMFSHGQRQLFNIARAIARRIQGKVVILDEITSRYAKSFDHRCTFVSHLTELLFIAWTSRRRTS
jgi:ABC-type multidrug transport system fused ATPase/permease subunit